MIPAIAGIQKRFLLLMLLSIGEGNPAEGWKKIAAHKEALVEGVCQALELPALYTDPGYAAPDLEACDAGITACDALVAQTGSVLVTSRSAGGRALSGSRTR